MKKNLFTLLSLLITLSCVVPNPIQKEKIVSLPNTITSIVINNSYIPIEIVGTEGNDIVFTATGTINLYTNDKVINEPVIKLGENSALIYFQVFEDNLASFSFNENNEKTRPLLRIQLPSQFSGSLTLNNYGYNAKATIKNFTQLDDFTYLVNDSDLTLENIKGKNATFNLNSADLKATQITFQNTTINAKTSCTISLSGNPGNITATTQNYMPFTAKYDSYNGEIIDISTYSGGGSISLPSNASFSYNLFSTSGKIDLIGFANNNSKVNQINKKQGVVTGSSSAGEIRYNSYTNSFTLKKH